jgi:SAM-dependent methyltransferase
MITSTRSAAISEVNDPNRPMYSAEWFDVHEQEMLASARGIVPIVVELIRPRSVLDLGCGRGAWLRVFKEHGVSYCRGLDGDHVEESRLLIEAEEFLRVDLESALVVDGTFDLAVCLEVVEHLSPAAGEAIVSALTSAAPLVLFSAAVPGQGGLHHVNEQWPQYWETSFASRGYRRLDPIRREIWQDSSIGWWYRQNILLYASEAAIARSDSLQAEHAVSGVAELELVHCSVLRKLVQAERRSVTLRNLLRELPGALDRAARSRVRNLYMR